MDEYDAEVVRLPGLNGAPVLSPATPLESAREMLARRYTVIEGRTLHRHQGMFYAWTGTHYRQANREEMRSAIYDFLDGAQRLNQGELVPFNPNRTKVDHVLDALGAAALVPDTMRAPVWLGDAGQLPASEMLACANGLLHLPMRKLLPHTPAFFNLNAVQYAFQATVKPPTAWLA